MRWVRVRVKVGVSQSVLDAHMWLCERSVVGLAHALGVGDVGCVLGLWNRS